MTLCQEKKKEIDGTRQNETSFVQLKPDDYSGHAHGNCIKHFSHFRPSVTLHYTVIREK